MGPFLSYIEQKPFWSIPIKFIRFSEYPLTLISILLV